MLPPSPPNADEIRDLTSFLAASERPEETFSYHELRGFLFAIAVAPELVQPSEWLPMIFAGEEAGFRTLAEAERITAAIMGCYNATVATRRSKGRIPPLAVGLDPDDAEVLRLWGLGFASGIQELDEDWDAAFESFTEDEFEHFEGVFHDLTIWIDPTARQKRMGLSDSEMDQMLEDCRELLPDLLGWFAAIGLEAAERTTPPSPAMRRSGTPVGRNDPCPCGSGKKYKKCCGIN